MNLRSNNEKVACFWRIKNLVLDVDLYLYNIVDFVFACRLGMYLLFVSRLFCDVCHAFVFKSWFCLCNVYLPFVLHFVFVFCTPKNLNYLWGVDFLKAVKRLQMM